MISVPIGKSVISRLDSPLGRCILTGAGALALLFFYFNVWGYRWVSYSDFDQIYMAGLAWRRGITPYGHAAADFSVPNGPAASILNVYYYLPLGSMLAAPLSLLPFPAACFVWRFGVYTLLLAGIWRFSRIVLPDWPVAFRVFALGVVALSSAVRWTMVQLQPSALVAALLVLFACEVIEGRWRRGLLYGLLVSIKMTYILPVVGLLLFRRQYLRLGILLAAIVALNAVALLPTGPARTLTRYAAVMRHVQDPGGLLYPSAIDNLSPMLNWMPNTPLARFRSPRKFGFSGEYMHLTYALSAWTFALNPTPSVGKGAADADAVETAQKLSLLVSVVLLGVMAALWRRSVAAGLTENRFFLALVFVVLTNLGILTTYHQRYDAVALLPTVFVVLAWLQRYPRHVWAWIALVVTLVQAVLLTSSMVVWWYGRVVVPYGLLVLTPVSAYMTITIFGVTVILLRHSLREAEASSTSAAVKATTEGGARPEDLEAVTNEGRPS